MMKLRDFNKQRAIANYTSSIQFNMEHKTELTENTLRQGITDRGRVGATEDSGGTRGKEEPGRSQRGGGSRWSQRSGGQKRSQSDEGAGRA